MVKTRQKERICQGAEIRSHAEAVQGGFLAGVDRFPPTGEKPAPTHASASHTANTLADGTDLDKLAKAVAMHETKDCGLNYGSSKYNGCFGVMQWDKQGSRSFKRYASKEESYEDFKQIWAKNYKKFPDSRLASRYSGNDRANIWLANVTTFYNELN